MSQVRGWVWELDMLGILDFEVQTPLSLISTYLWQLPSSSTDTVSIKFNRHCQQQCGFWGIVYAAKSSKGLHLAGAALPVDASSEKKNPAVPTPVSGAWWHYTVTPKAQADPRSLLSGIMHRSERVVRWHKAVEHIMLAQTLGIYLQDHSLLYMKDSCYESAFVRSEHRPWCV